MRELCTQESDTPPISVQLAYAIHDATRFVPYERLKDVYVVVTSKVMKQLLEERNMTLPMVNADDAYVTVMGYPLKVLPDDYHSYFFVGLAYLGATAET